ncbi:hypothetical protein D0867_14495 [Hortaea werneckii]|uniref:Mitochondrial outer membrane transport complex Sam37/metaxin N-terminal domain-containing protein n=1 Tax=Hortaea werneckii TaxID=91943 RepID=A0A3M6XQ23_HORWE|nr:hypothetical protein D0867_14495 [Hortaea werneckii]RMY09816.1 hypothetical protein D0866_14568 [Hortaea werneckii]
MELYVLGPAFGCPSIDAQCSAAIALLQWRYPDGQKEWKVIPTHEQDGQLPLLADGNLRLGGFGNIARHVLGAEDYSGQLDAKDHADLTAASSFLEANGQNLLDISLYVSFENYSTTRSAFTRILPQHANFIIPPRRRAGARARTEHLGVSSIDIDNVHDDLSGRTSNVDGVGKEQNFEVEAQKRASLLLPRKDTLKSLLKRPEHAATFKMHALADNFFGPLQDMLGDKPYLVGEKMTSVDCQAYGYLCLMLFPQLPHNWLHLAMKRKYVRLVRYVERIHAALRLQVNVDDILSLSNCKTDADLEGRRKACDMSLPWCPPTSATFSDIVTMTLGELMQHVPLLKTPPTVLATNRVKAPLWQRYLPAFVAATVGSIGLGVYFAVRTGPIIWPHGEQAHIFGRKRFSDFGHLGSALAGVGLLTRQAQGEAAFQQQQQQEAGQPVHVDVAVQGDGGA